MIRDKWCVFFSPAAVLRQLGVVGVLELASIFIVCVLFNCCSGSFAAGASELAKTVDELGLHPGEPGYGFDILAGQPHEAVTLLVNQLHPIAHRVYFESKKTSESRHILACLRALHYVTGRTLVVSTTAKLNDQERQFLDFDKTFHDSNPSHKIHFFGVWMSRDAEFVAPRDAQFAIIKEWKRFQQEEGADFKYRPAVSADKSMEEWYWFG